MTKILYVTSLSGKRINSFMFSSIIAAKEANLDFHIACNQNEADSVLFKEDCENLGITPHHIDFNRNPLNPENLKAYKQLLLLMKKENYDIVHCNTAIGGLLGRICAKKAGIKKIIYMAHGFHFYKGSSIVNWLMYYPVEYFLSRYTDYLITINQEDYSTAQNFKAKNVTYVHGVGIDIMEIHHSETDRKKKREELGIPENAFVILSVGELNENKNHETVIKAVAELNNKNCFYVICGKGHKENDFKNLSVSLGIEEQVKLLGFRSDVHDICKLADAFAFPSYREGLSVALMEAMAAELPIVCSKIRGNTDLVEDGIGGYLIEPTDAKGFAKAFSKIINDEKLRGSMGKKNVATVKNFDLENAIKEIKDVYKKVM
jgi:glycosyltransferase involved in cell wall biosynthesis